MTVIVCNVTTKEVTTREYTPEEQAAIADYAANEGAVIARANAIAQIEKARDAALLEGVSWNGKSWHTDATFQMQLTGIVAAFEAGILAPEATVDVRAMDNSVNALAQAQCKQLAGAVMVKVQTVWAQSWAAKDAL